MTHMHANNNNSSNSDNTENDASSLHDVSLEDYDQTATETDISENISSGYALAHSDSSIILASAHIRLLTHFCFRGDYDPFQSDNSQEGLVSGQVRKADS